MNDVGTTTERRRFLWIVSFFLGLILFVFGSRAYLSEDLRSTKLRIESEFSGLLTLIEARAKDPNLNRRVSMADFKRVEEIRAEIRSHMPVGLVYSADWSDDGHHGAESLFDREGNTGCLYISGFSCSDEMNSRSLMYGRGSDGTALYIYRVWLDGATKRQYLIYFDRNALNAHFKARGKKP